MQWYIYILYNILIYYTYICTYTYTYTYVYTHIYIYIHIYTHTHTHTDIHACMHACIHSYIHTFIHSCIHTYIHTSIHEQLAATVVSVGTCSCGVELAQLYCLSLCWHWALSSWAKRCWTFGSSVHRYVSLLYTYMDINMCVCNVMQCNVM